MSIHAKTRAVAAELGDWSYSAGRGFEHIAFLSHAATGAEAALILWANRDTHIEVAGQWPTLPWGTDASPENIGLTHREGIRSPRIRCAANRSARDIARDFRRRFEGRYLDTWRRCYQYWTNAVVADDTRGALCAELVALAPSGAVSGDGRRRGEHRGIVRHGVGELDRWSGHVEVTSYGIKLDLHGLTADEARRVLAALVAAP